jgi:glucose-6-phosphate 1-dehydrogenase
LGKETLRDILSKRRTSPDLESKINKDFIDSIQITAAEDFGIGKRGGYYDKVGALKDVGQNHKLQMLAFSTMEIPKKFEGKEIIAERIKLLKSLMPLAKRAVFGQYEGYTSEQNVDPDSQTETFYALKIFIENERFESVPIYIRAGKKLKKTLTTISIIFKDGSVLVFNIGLSENYHSRPDPYENMLIDAANGDQTFFNSRDEVEAQWAFIDPLIKAKEKVQIYKVGTWGPKEANDLIKADGRDWISP